MEKTSSFNSDYEQKATEWDDSMKPFWLSGVGSVAFMKNGIPHAWLQLFPPSAICCRAACQRINMAACGWTENGTTLAGSFALLENVCTCPTRSGLERCLQPYVPGDWQSSQSTHMHNLHDINNPTMLATRSCLRWAEQQESTSPDTSKVLIQRL